MVMEVIYYVVVACSVASDDRFYMVLSTTRMLGRLPWWLL